MHKTQLFNALEQGSLTLTATGRLARSLLKEYGASQISKGITVWESPCSTQV